MAGFIVNLRGEPVPPSEAIKRLNAIDRRLTLKWVGGLAPYWGIVEPWSDDDPRWQDVSRGLVPKESAYEVRAMLPPDCSPEEVEGFVLRYFERVTDPKRQAFMKLERVRQHNQAVKQAHKEAFLVEQEEKHARTTKHELELVVGGATAHPISSGFGAGTLGGEGAKSL